MNSIRPQVDQDTGLRLLRHAASARDEFVCVAPFIKLGALRRVLAKLNDGVDLRVVTRWRPEEVLAGVSDPQILDHMIERPGSSVFLRYNLHAKYFRSDARVLVGSANLTAAALGWTAAPNFELLEFIDVDRSWVDRFEDLLFSGSVEATVDLRDAVLAAAEALSEAGVLGSAPDEMIEGVPTTIQSGVWVPSLRNPEELFDHYVGSEEHATRAARTSAHEDLSHLGVPLGLSRSAFRDYVGVILMQEPLVRMIDDFVVVPRRFGEVRDLIARETKQARPVADRSWQSVMRWLVWYLPGRYSTDVPRHSEVFARR